jgi:ubiquinone/menaquinone biosynthesis C-methylase UbiE
MTDHDKHRVCPVEHAGHLDTKMRRLLQNPRMILKPYIHKGMKVLDLGCGPGFFSIEMAKIAGQSGKVTAADLQEKMLDIVAGKIRGTNLEKRIELKKTQKNKTGLTGRYDFILVFYLLHEVPDQALFMKEIKTLLKPDGRVLISEPMGRVSGKEFKHSIIIIENCGFEIVKRPKIFFSRSAVIKKVK